MFHWSSVWMWPHSLEFWHLDHAWWYLGQVRRSRSQVKGQGHQVNTKHFFMKFHHSNAIRKWLIRMKPVYVHRCPRNMTVRPMTWGVLKAFLFFYCLGSWAPCGLGTFHVGPGNDDCQPCSPGHFMSNPNHVMSGCDPCEAGKFTANSASISCDDCSPGYYSQRGANICRPCSPGSFAENMGSSQCQSCSPGTYSEEGAISCEECSANFYCPGGTDQILCPEGMISGAGASSCHHESDPGKWVNFSSLTMFPDTCFKSKPSCPLKWVNLQCVHLFYGIIFFKWL